ncbi:7TM diverse intracellular signaling domain-containing protein, partial [Pedobacter sp.]|uniref:7TM-DISM domain-containing protein n=1 Tax=Pedobacter sp. TaxID=1411316 RepID=UPI003C66C47D
MRHVLPLSLIFASFFVFGQSLELAAQRPSFVKNGELDLRNHNFTNGEVMIKGNWKFYWNQLLTPHNESKNFEYVRFPELWQNLRWEGRRRSSTGFASYRIKLLLPKSRYPLGLKIPSFYSSYRLYLDGKLIAANGTPGKSKQQTIPFWSTQVKPLPVHADTVEVLLQIANFHHSKGGGLNAIWIGELDRLESKHRLANAVDYFLTGCLIMGGFFFLALYLSSIRDKVILYFSLFCLIYSYRIFGSENYALHALVPNISWSITIHLEYVSLFLSVAMFSLYTRNLFPEEAPKTLFAFLAGICGVFAALTLILPPTIFGMLVDPFIVIIGFYMLIGTYCYWRAYRNNRTGSGYALLSTGAIFTIAICSIVRYYGTEVPFENVFPIAYVGFFFLQSLILSQRFAHSLQLAKQQGASGLKAKSDFLSTISHEIRTPLNSVIGMSYLLNESAPRPDQAEYLSVLQFSAKNLLNIVNDVLSFSSIDAGKMLLSKEAMDLGAIVRNIVSSHEAEARKKGVGFFLEYDSDIPFQIEGDITRTTQVIDNLLFNAVKFTSDGHVRLSVKILRRKEKEIILKIAVTDTGIGIPKSKQKDIFERFTQADTAISRHYGGTGLGLSICKGILGSQGIDLLLESEEGVGSCFYFVQPFKILTEKKPERADSAFSNQYPLENVHVLIAEDTLVNVIVIQNFLKKWGASAEVAKNGKEAVD